MRSPRESTRRRTAAPAPVTIRRPPGRPRAARRPSGPRRTVRRAVIGEVLMRPVEASGADVVPSGAPGSRRCRRHVADEVAGRCRRRQPRARRRRSRSRSACRWTAAAAPATTSPTSPGTTRSVTIEALAEDEANTTSARSESLRPADEVDQSIGDGRWLPGSRARPDRQPLLPVTTIVEGRLRCSSCLPRPGTAARPARACGVAHVRRDRRRPDGELSTRTSSRTRSPSATTRSSCSSPKSTGTGCAWSISPPPCTCRRAA